MASAAVDEDGAEKKRGTQETIKGIAPTIKTRRREREAIPFEARSNVAPLAAAGPSWGDDKV